MRSDIPMSIQRTTLPVEVADDRPRNTRGRPRVGSLLRMYRDLAHIWIRKAMAPGGVRGIVMAFVLVVVTDALLLGMRSIQELPPVSLTFLIPIIFAAIRWGTLCAALTAIGGAFL